MLNVQQLLCNVDIFSTFFLIMKRYDLMCPTFYILVRYTSHLITYTVGSIICIIFDFVPHFVPRHITIVIVTLNTPHNYDHVLFFILQVPTPDHENTRTDGVINMLGTDRYLYADRHIFPLNKKSPSFPY